MGLDQNAYCRHPGDLKEHEEEIAYWRKHNRLQGWMQALWEKKGRPNFDPETMGGSMGVFNCVPVYLTVKDLEKLENDINDKKLPETAGFFFGEDSYQEYENYYKAEDLAFIDIAKDKLNKGYEVWYTSWW